MGAGRMPAGEGGCRMPVVHGFHSLEEARTFAEKAGQKWTILRKDGTNFRFHESGHGKRKQKSLVRGVLKSLRRNHARFHFTKDQGAGPCSQGETAANTGCTPKNQLGSGKKPRKRPKPSAEHVLQAHSIAEEARQAHESGDREALGNLARRVTTAASAKGGMGAAGLKALARTLGVKGGESKAGIAQAITEHLTGLGKPQHGLTARLDKIKQTEERTGTKFKERLINAAVAQLRKDDPEFQWAVNDIKANGADASAESFTLLSSAKQEALSKLQAGEMGDVALTVADAGGGSLRPQEVKDYLAGNLKGSGDVLPDEMGLVPISDQPKPESKKPQREEDYIDRIRKPLAERLEGVREWEQHQGHPFVAEALSEVIRDHGTNFPHKDEYLYLASTPDKEMTAADWGKYCAIKQDYLRRLNRGEVSDERMADALERIDQRSRGRATVKVDELKQMLNRVEPRDCRRY